MNIHEGNGLQDKKWGGGGGGGGSIVHKKIQHFKGKRNFF